MARTFVALLLAIVFSTHMAAPSASSVESAAQSLSTAKTFFEIDGSADGDGVDTAPVSSQAGSKCHDQCQGFMALHKHALGKIRSSPIDGRQPKLSFADVAIIVPPPQRVA